MTLFSFELDPSSRRDFPYTVYLISASDKDDAVRKMKHRLCAYDGARFGPNVAKFQLSNGVDIYYRMHGINVDSNTFIVFMDA